MPCFPPKAAGLFELARISCEFILAPEEGGPSPDDRFERILSSFVGGRRSPLDQIYTFILKWAIPLARYRLSSMLRQVLGTLEPRPVASLNEMRRFFPTPQDHFNVEPILKSLAPLVAGVTRPLLFDPSFRDFLTDRAWSGSSSLT